MIIRQANVRAFMEKHGAAVDQDLCAGPLNQHVAISLRDAANALQVYSKLLEREARAHAAEGDWRLMRAHLQVEETAEMLLALARRDPILLADAIADVLYVTLGVAATYGLDADELVCEAHTSNMTKKVSADVRVRDKGPSYVPPNFGRLVARHDEARRQRLDRKFQTAAAKEMGSMPV